MLNLSLKQLSQNLNDKTFSSQELTEFFLSRIKKYNEQLNAFITIDESSSLSMAKVADDKISKGEHKPLTGIPIAQKDIFCAEGWRTTCGSKMLENFTQHICGCSGEWTIESFKEIAIEKFSGSGSFSGMSVFLEISSFNGKKEINMHSISGGKFFEKL